MDNNEERLYRFEKSDIIFITEAVPDFSKINYHKAFVLSDDVLRYMRINKFVPNDEKHKNSIEVWAFARFDRNDIHKEFSKEKRYIISTFGRVYDVFKMRMLSASDSSGYFVTASGEKYKKVNVHIYDEHTIYYVHRLLASTFIKKPNKYYNVVNHIDEHPYNNYIWNLEWTDKSGNANMHNTWVRSNETNVVPTKTIWSPDDIKEICYLIAEGHKATYIYNTLIERHPDNPMITYERIRTMYKHIMKRGDFHDIALSCGVKFNNTGKPDYTKETGSVLRAMNNNT